MECERAGDSLEERLCEESGVLDFGWVGGAFRGVEETGLVGGVGLGW